MNHPYQNCLYQTAEITKRGGFFLSSPLLFSKLLFSTLLFSKLPLSKLLFSTLLSFTLFSFMILPSQLSLSAQSNSSNAAQLPTQSRSGKTGTNEKGKNGREEAESKQNIDKQNIDKQNADKQNADKQNANKQNVDKQNANKQNVDKKSLKELMERAEEHFFHQRYNVALRLFEVIIRRDPENARAYRFAGDVYLLQEKWKEAEEHFHIARELSEQPEEEWFRIAQVKILLGDGKEAEKALKKALALKPDMHLCHFYLGIIAYRLFRDKEKTIYHWENYIKSNPSNKKKVERAVTILRDKDYVIPYPSSNFAPDDHPPPSRYNK